MDDSQKNRNKIAQIHNEVVAVTDPVLDMRWDPDPVIKIWSDHDPSKNNVDPQPFLFIPIVVVYHVTYHTVCLKS